jgi:hypothetical protein
MVNRAADARASAVHFGGFAFIDVLNLFGDLWSGIERKKQDWNRALACSGSVGIGPPRASRGPLRTPRARRRRNGESSQHTVTQPTICREKTCWSKRTFSVAPQRRLRDN